MFVIIGVMGFRYHSVSFPSVCPIYNFYRVSGSSCETIGVIAHDRLRMIDVIFSDPTRSVELDLLKLDATP